jgi:hypothetical protein
MDSLAWDHPLVVAVGSIYALAATVTGGILLFTPIAWLMGMFNG